MEQDRSPSQDQLPDLKADNSTTCESTPELTNVNTAHHSTIFKTPDTRKTRGSDGGLARSLTVGSGSKSPIRRHLRTISIASSTSPACSSTTNSARKGINIGISLVGPVPSGTGGTINKDKESTSKTPRRKLFPAKNGNAITLVSPNLKEFHSEQHNDIHESSSLDQNNDDISSIMNSSPTPLSPSKLNNIPQDELSENFRLLASKEMEVLEIKNQLKDLLQRKKDKEFELQQLKLRIEKQLMENLKQQNNEQYRHRFEQHTPKSPTSLQKSVVQPSSSYIDPLMDDSFFPVSSNVEDEKNKRQSWFSKPLNFIQQFDNLIYKEFEKLQIPDDDELNVSKDTSVVDISYNLERKSPNRKEINAPIKSLAGDSEASSSTDVMQSVSQHLWSFVNDVKSNLLVEENEPVSQPPATSKLSVTNTTSRLENPKSRLRTASISKRQSYSQHSHKKRSSSNSVKAENTLEEGKDKQDIGNEFTNEGISDVVRSISKHDDSGSETATEMKSGLPDKLLDNYIKDSDLWDSEPLDL